MPPLLKIIWFFLPAAAANVAPVFVRNFPVLAVPVDFGKNIFGNNKTWRGILFGIAVAIVVALIQYKFGTMVMLGDFSDTSAYEALTRGFLLGVGALGGDILKSFFKRRIGIAPGKSLLVADQIDWIVGVFVVTSLFFSEIFYTWTPQTLLLTLLLFGSLHILTNVCGYFLGMRAQPI